ncbi:molybdopterin-dependent oxidoreductase [Natronomonas amylolytica]|uniref:molybdopterin-dependent oxidoreductase n=1 Tax=Natronomonas amylolytica TaxID=3108498 RepID=UPI0030091B18
MSNLRTHDVPDAVDPSDWALRVTGAVAEPLYVERDDLAAFPVETVTEDFECVEGWVAAGLSWRGVRVSSVLNRADPTVDDGYVLVHAMDGDYACSFPQARAADALLAFELDGEPLAVTHGGPARFVPTDGDADCWESVKWVAALEVSASEPVADDTAEEIAMDRVG